MSFAEHFETRQVERLDLSHYCRVASGCSVGATLKHMVESDQNCAFVMQQSRLVGIFTDRDVLEKVVDTPDCWADPIDSVMTRAPVTVAATATAMDALRLVNSRRLRNLPALNSDGAVIGNAGFFGLMHLAHVLVREAQAKTRGEISVGQDLFLASLPGLMSHKPVTVAPGASLADCVQTMRGHDIGALIVVDGRGGIAGVFSERELLTKVAGKLDRLDTQAVGEFMNSDVPGLSPRDSIATALEHMTRRRIRRLPLVDAGDKPTGVVGFRDIAVYIERSSSA